MNFPETHPLWMWLYFGSLGTIAAILFTLIVWNWMKFQRTSEGAIRTAAAWNMAGLTCLFIAEWFACGIGGNPGRLLSGDPSIHYLFGGTLAAILAMFFSVPGWIFILIGQTKMLRNSKNY